ncbi:Hydroxymethylglutaryl-CoA lyase [Desulfosarcina cetonica]|nr:Hydroxymethylglutaryl-CoA lyase [Desulfosarcina cetonica]
MRIVEVGPRDGLQNETAPIPAAAKIAFVDALSDSGVAEIEVSAFVSPRWVPQLRDAAAVFAGITRRPGVVYSALVPNRQGLDQALAAGADKIAVFTAASETFARKNINTSIEGSMARFRPVVAAAHAAGLPVRGYVSTAFWCAFEGHIAPAAVIAVVNRLMAIGVDEVAISDTIGKATPEEVARLFDQLRPHIAAERMAAHFHDTYGRGVVNALAAWEAGIPAIDASVGGLGGCPYAPGASGNVATDDIVAALEERGIPTGVDRRRLAASLEHLAPYRIDARRRLPEKGSPVCAACPFSTGTVCCKHASGQS